MELPLVSCSLPGIEGTLRETVEDFRVEEIPAYEPSGDGDHLFVWLEKRDLSTFEAVTRIARALDLNPADLGTAGLKDRRAVTRQFVSIPSPVTPAQAEELQVDGVTVLSVARHNNKLKTGHLRGNRFTLRVRNVGDADHAAERAVQILHELARAPGSPNWFGEQRFGSDGRNAEVGRALITGDKLPGRPPQGRQRRLYISAYQSSLFNNYLTRRINDGLYRTVIAGELLSKRPTGGMFSTEDPATDQPRLDSGELTPTGPMFGHKMRLPPDGSAAAERERAILEEADITLASFARVGKLAQGTRRPLAVPLEDAAVIPLPPDAIEVTFSLPAGAYATAVMRELLRQGTLQP